MDASDARFRCFSSRIETSTKGELDVVNVTGEVERRVAASGVVDGVAHLFVPGQTAALTTIEYEPGAVADLKLAICRLAPENTAYEHNARWGDGNGRSHVRAAIIGPSLSVPVMEGVVLLGTWQQVVLIELDLRARNRLIHVTVVGEGRADLGGKDAD